ncbi:MAG: hypothetical protein NZM27_07820, partial [Acetobacteraceae bacterium]|nr:hypothetical protein [Acetobacteraceae bacterium]MCX7683797.1 hypothetical protein [Acetobacteraceae bacterium]MDW8398328.1 hypothetical protein [Acetobacteraceae bacterium]
MSALPAPVLLADLALAVLAAEAAALWALRRFLGRGPGLRPFALLLLAGAALLAALRVALSEGDPGWIVLCFALAGAAHGADLRRRLSAPGGGRMPVPRQR